MKIIILIISFIFGIIFGSLFNVLIYRIPRNISVVFPNSSCPNCGHKIKPYENIPILSYIFLRGKCSNCKNPISIRYPLVEFLTGLYFSLCVYLFYLKSQETITLDIGLLIKTTEAIIFGSILIVQSFIDLDWFILLDSFTYTGILIGIGFSLSGYGFVNIKESIVGILTGGILPSAIYFIYLKLRKMEGLGIGDIKLLAMIGAFGGIFMVLGAMFIGSVLGLLMAIPMIVKNKNMQFYIPFGPFLSIGAILYMFSGNMLEKVLWI